MPGACAPPELHGWMPRPFGATAELWLAVAFHDPSRTISRGSDDSSSGTGHGVFRARLAARARATSADDTVDARLPNALRTYDVIDATHSSLFMPIGTMTSGYVAPLIGPDSPCSSALIT